MKRITFILFFILQVSAQNLVSNPSFEDTINCPYSTNQIHYAARWTNPNPNGTPDYFNSCNNSINGFLGVPNSAAGYQYARTGSSYAGVASYIDSNSFCYQLVLERNYREFIQNELWVTLDTGKTYCGGYWVNLSNNLQNYASDGFRMRLTEIPTLISGPLGTYPTWPPDSYVQNYNGIISDTLNWVLVSDTFIAKGNEKYALIGNLNHCNQTGHIQFSNDSSCYAYYYIDDAFIYEQKPVFIKESSLQYCDTIGNLYIHADNSVYYEWYMATHPATILSTKDSVQLNLSPGTYDLVVKADACHYTSYDTLHIEIIDCDNETIPNIITPDGNGLNDFFRIKDLQPNSMLTIYNRWGMEIYHTDDYKNDFPKENYSQGVYYYVLRNPQGTFKKGFFHIFY